MRRRAALLVRIAVLAGAAPFFAGSLAALSSGEVLAQIYSSLRTGALHVQSPLGTVELHFREGEVIAGSASNQRLRLGNLLICADQYRQIQLGDHLLLFRNAAIDKRTNLGDELIGYVTLGTREVGP